MEDFKPIQERKMKTLYLTLIVIYHVSTEKYILVNLKEQILRFTVFSFSQNRYCVVIGLLFFFLSHSSKKIFINYGQDKTKKDWTVIL